MPELPSTTPDRGPGGQVPLSVWPVAQASHPAQRIGRYLPCSNAHPARMLPALARHAIQRYSRPGELVIDPMCGIGTTLVEAVHLGRDVAGVELEPRWAELAERNLARATDDGASGIGSVIAGDARRLPRLLAGQLDGGAALVLTSPPYGTWTHGRVHTRREQGNSGQGQKVERHLHPPRQPCEPRHRRRGRPAGRDDRDPGRQRQSAASRRPGSAHRAAVAARRHPVRRSRRP